MDSTLNTPKLVEAFKITRDSSFISSEAVCAVEAYLCSHGIIKKEIVEGLSDYFVLFNQEKSKPSSQPALVWANEWASGFKTQFELHSNSLSEDSLRTFALLGLTALALFWNEDKQRPQAARLIVNALKKALAIFKGVPPAQPKEANLNLLEAKFKLRVEKISTRQSKERAEMEACRVELLKRQEEERNALDEDYKRELAALSSGPARELRELRAQGVRATALRNKARVTSFVDQRRR